MPGTISQLIHPSVVIRQKALYRGILGPSRAWKLVAIVVFGRGLFRKFFGKRPDHLGIEKLTAGQTVCITSLSPRERGRKKARQRASLADRV